MIALIIGYMINVLTRHRVIVEVSVLFCRRWFDSHSCSKTMLIFYFMLSNSFLTNFIGADPKVSWQTMFPAKALGSLWEELRGEQGVWDRPLLGTLRGNVTTPLTVLTHR